MPPLILSHFDHCIACFLMDDNDDDGVNKRVCARDCGMSICYQHSVAHVFGFFFRSRRCRGPPSPPPWSLDDRCSFRLLYDIFKGTITLERIGRKPSVKAGFHYKRAPCKRKKFSYVRQHGNVDNLSVT